MIKIYNMDCLIGMQHIPPNSIDLIITDPPYEFEAMGGGVHRVGKGVVKYQNIIDAKTNHFDFYKFIPFIIDAQMPSINAYFFCNKTLIPDYLNIAKEKKLNFDILALRKLNPIPAKNSSYLPELEYIIFLRSKGVYFNGKLPAKNYTKIYDKYIGKENVYHPNQKPLELIRKFIEISSKPGDLILDPFMGSGTTAVACKQLNRNFIGFEIDKKDYEIAKKRLEQDTLHKWEKLNFPQEMEV